jgi:hypothetical protein
VNESECWLGYELGCWSACESECQLVYALVNASVCESVYLCWSEYESEYLY